MNIGFIGIGAMGYCMAVNLMGKGYRVIAYDIAKENVQKVCKEGAVAAATPAELARQSDLIVSMLPETKDTARVLEGPDGVAAGAREGCTFIDMGTGDPVLFKRLSAELKEKYKINLVDAPVSGGVPKAKTGELSVIVSGPKEVIDGARPVLECLAASISHVGEEVGTGQVIKLLNNMLSNSYLVLLCEVLVLGKKCGLSPHMLVDIFNQSAGQSSATTHKAPNFILKRNFAAGFKAKLALKDLTLATNMAKEKSSPTPMVSLAQQYFLSAVANGKGEYDTTIVLTLLEELTGVVVE